MRVLQYFSRFFLFSLLIALSILLPAILVAEPALQFVPVPPCRVADTRNPNGPFGGPSINGGTSREFMIPQSACSIPGNAAAYSLNVTVVPHGSLGFLTTWPSGQPQPLVSTLNSFDGRIKANAVIVGAGGDEGVSVYVSDTADLVLDINGYFVSSNNTGLAFYTLTPCRVLDTRNPPGQMGGPNLSANVARNFPILASGCNIPSSAQAYSLNVTAVPRGPLWFLSVWPAGQPWPGVSTLNAPTGTAVANGAIVPSGTGGAIQALASDDTHMLVDINGYFAPIGSGGLSLFPTQPCRVIDTRNQQGNFQGELSVGVVGSACGIPAQAQSYVLNATVVPPGPLGFLSLWPDGQPQPLVSTLNSYDGAVTSNLAIVPTTNGVIDAYASELTPLILDISSYFAPQTCIAVPPQSLPGGLLNTPYTAAVSSYGGIPPYSWSITAGILPTGLNLNGDGTITGTPTVTGNFPFTIQVQDSLSSKATANLGITVISNPVYVDSEAVPVGNVNVNYSVTLTASGGTQPYAWSIAQGSLPSGLAIDPSTGTISGVPTATGSFTFTVQVKDHVGSTGTEPFTIIIGSGAQNASLSGRYAIAINGFKNQTGAAVFNIGSFVADGNGKITSGYVDIAKSDKGISSAAITGGAYSIDATGVGVISMTDGTGYINFAIAVATSGNIRVISFVNADGTESFGTGTIAKQDPSKFSLASLTGPFASLVQGVDQGLYPFVSGAAFVLNGTGGMTNGETDANDNTRLTHATFTGTLSAIDPSTGRCTVTESISDVGTIHFVLYVVSGTQFFAMGTDPVQSNALYIGSAIKQSTSNFNNAYLSGNGILEMAGLNVWQEGQNLMRGPQLDVGLFAADGNGNVSFSVDENHNGTMSQFSGTGTYSVAANGRAPMENTVLYLTNTNHAFVVNLGGASSGILEAQVGSNFNNSSFSGNYLGGSVPPISYGAEARFFIADGNGNFSATGYRSDVMQMDNFTGTYSVSSTGRSVAYANNQQVAIGYVVSATKYVGMTTEDQGYLISYEH